jgi:hypothetical protein
VAPRQEFREDRPDVVDILIRAVLRQRVAGARPSPCVWERIEEQAQRLATRKSSRATAPRPGKRDGERGACPVHHRHLTYCACAAHASAGIGIAYQANFAAPFDLYLKRLGLQ